MNKNKIIQKMLSYICLDERIKDGIFKIEDDIHMGVLREYLIKKGCEKNMVTEFSNLVLEGKFPERQAYNSKGLLITFPTPDYKKAAIERGTHFEENPLKSKSNLFQEPNSTDNNNKNNDNSSDVTNLPVSQTTTVDKNNSIQTQNKNTDIQTTAAPQQTPETQPTNNNTDNKIIEPTNLPPPSVKSPKEKEMDKNAIKTILKSDDYMLDEVIQHIIFNAPYIMEDIKKRL